MTAYKKKDNIFYLGVFFLLLSLLIIIGGYFFVHHTFTLTQFIGDFYANVGAEFGGIAITIIIVDRIVKRQERKENEFQTKYKLLNDLHSPVNSIANNAVHELRTLGKLSGQDAWTVSAKLGGKADLTNARLYDTNFFSARLVGANFSKADLRNVNFFNTDLTGAILFDSDIAGAKFNENTILPDGTSWNKHTDLSKYVTQPDLSQITQNWLSQIDTSGEEINFDNLLTQKITARNLIYYLNRQYPNVPVAENELHFYRHWNALLQYDYETISDVDDLLSRTEEARKWMWEDKAPLYKIIHISFSIALENPTHLNLPHWNQLTKNKIKEARQVFYNQST